MAITIVNGVRGVHDARSENHADGVQIVGHARHQVAGAIFRIELGIHGQQAVEQIVSQVIFNFTRHPD